MNDTPHPRRLRSARVPVLWAFTIALALALSAPARAQDAVAPPPGGQSVLPAGALLTTPVGGLASTNATAAVVPATGAGFAQALQVTIRATSPETNATQLTMPISVPVRKGDCLLASFDVRGASATGGPGQVAFLFERRTNPWTNSVTQGVATAADPSAWKHVVVPFTSQEDYNPGEAMCSLRMAFGPQTVAVGGLSVVDYGHATTLHALTLFAAQENPLGDVTVVVHTGDKRQALLGLGGDFCQPRYGETQAIDAVGSYTLDHLSVAQARVGVPLNDWAPQPGVYTDTAQAHAAFLLMQILARRHVPIIGTVWEGPQWMLPGGVEKSGRVLDPSQYGACIDAIGKFLVTARDTYGVTVDYFSFNEPDYGVNFLFTPATMDAFIRQAGPRFAALGLKTRFLVGDTTGGMKIVDYARPLLDDTQIAPYLGPIAFHCWDSLGAPDRSYAAVAELGKAYHKTILSTEGGFNSGLWQKPDPWSTWDNGLKTALAYAKTLRLSGASAIDYWTYENNYPLVGADGTPFPVFDVVQQLEDALPAGAHVVGIDLPAGDGDAAATAGPKRGEFSVILVNPVGAGRMTLTGLPPGARVLITERDDDAPTTAAASDARVDAAGRLTVAMPMRSVVTVRSAAGQ